MYQQTFNDGFWELTPANGFASPDFEISCKIDELLAFGISGDERILTRGSATEEWRFDGVHGINDLMHVTRTGLSTLGDFALAADNDCMVDPPDGINGPTTVCQDSVVSYLAFEFGQSVEFYQWEVIGGTIIDGQGTSSIDVDWNGEFPTGIVEVRKIEGDCGVSSKINS